VIIGLRYGWKFHLLVIGPFGLKRSENGKIRFYFEKRFALWGGVGGTIPQDANPDKIKEWAMILLAGPMASIVLGSGFLTAGLFSESLFLILLGAMSLGMGTVSALPLPIKTGILYTDGGRVMRIRKGGQEAREEAAMLDLVICECTGASFTDVNDSFIETLINAKDYSIRYYGYYYKYKFHKAQNNLAEANFAISEMESIKDKVPAVIVSDCKYEQ